MKSSEKVDLIMKALSLAQGQIRGAKEDSTNPFFKSKYADLSSVWHACKDALISNGLCIMQPLEIRDGIQCLCTILAHSSGQWIESCMQMAQAKDAQELGKIITYYRRYMLAAIVGVCPEDDDAESHMQHQRQQVYPTSKPAEVSKPVAKLSADQVKALELLIAPGDEDYKRKILDGYSVKSFFDLPALTHKGDSNFEFIKDRIEKHNKELANQEMKNVSKVS